MHLLSDAIRGFIWAGPGKKLVVADYAGIEGAVIAWLADEQWKLAAMREIIADPSKPDMYRRTAASIMGVSTREIDKKHPLRQSVGKVSELALGFGGGVGAFASMARGYGVDLDALYEPVYDSRRHRRHRCRGEALQRRLQPQGELDRGAEPRGVDRLRVDQARLARGESGDPANVVEPRGGGARGGEASRPGRRRRPRPVRRRASFPVLPPAVRRGAWLTPCRS